MTTTTTRGTLTVLSRIDDNVEAVTDNVEGAQRELLKYWSRVSGNRMLVAKMFGVLMICKFHALDIPMVSLPSLTPHCQSFSYGFLLQDRATTTKCVSAVYNLASFDSLAFCIFSSSEQLGVPIRHVESGQGQQDYRRCNTKIPFSAETDNLSDILRRSSSVRYSKP